MHEPNTETSFGNRECVCVTVAPTHRTSPISLLPPSPQLSHGFLLPPTPSPGCDPNSWPDVDNGVLCGNCSALVNIGSYDTCNAYCAAQGMGCVNGWEENSDTCGIQFVAGCGYSFNSHGTSDAICECSPGTGSGAACTNQIQKPVLEIGNASV